MYISIWFYIDIWVYISNLCIDDFPFWPFTFFPFRHPVPRVVRRFDAEVPTSNGFVVLGLTPLIAGLGVRRYSMRLWRLA